MPWPDWSPFDYRRFSIKYDFWKFPTAFVQLSRGCTFTCNYCPYIIVENKTRFRDPQNVVAEIQHGFERYGFRSFKFRDPLFGLNRRIAWQLADSIRRLPYKIQFSIEGRIDLLREDTLHELQRAGLTSITVGIETPDEKGLLECNKKQNNNRDMVDSVKCIQRTGLEVQGGFIVGFDSDTPSIFQRQIDFIQKSGIVTAMVGLLQAPPGTRLYERLKKEGRLLGQMSGDTDGTTNIITQMDLQALHEGYRNIIRYIYSPRHYYQRVKVFLREYKAPRFEASMDFQRFMAFFRSGIRLGIFGKERFQYWRLLLWTLFRRPAFLSLAVTFAIHGHHFRKICKLYLI